VYERPASRFVADFIGTSNFIDATVAAKHDGTYEVETPAGSLRVASADEFPVGAKVVLCARPEHIQLSVASGNGAAPDVWHGTVENRAFLGEVVDHVVSVGGQTVRARCDANVSIPQGTDVDVAVRADACTLLPAE
jgi:iron(III) transport system ATP-binding protein